ncbi:MAG: hypothetical protein GC168_05580 [Candidatus Hydrogenedens sp.]|nr:hypothetical protein [Candidatus Hydrogenedens sp.]
MTPYEIILVVSTLFAAVAINVQAIPAPIRRLGVVGLLLGALALHGVMDEPRWQFYPLYPCTVLLLAVAAAERPEHSIARSGKLASSVLVILAALVAAGLGTVMPVLRLPDPGTVLGTFTQQLVDTNREEKYGPDPGRARRVMVQVWYPAASVPEGERAESWAPGIEKFGPALANFVGLPSFVLSHLEQTRSAAYLYAPAAKAPAEGYPLVVYSHGWTGFRNIAITEIERLAAAGFVVAAPDHTYGSAGTVMATGEVVLNDPSAMPEKDDPNRQESIEELVDTYAGDIRLVLDFMQEVQSGSFASPLAGKVDLGRVGIWGHSTGGGAVMEVAKTDPRVNAVAGLDIWSEPVSPDLRTKVSTIPLLSILSQDWYDNKGSDNNKVLPGVLKSFEGPKDLFYLKGAKHGDFTVLPLLTPLAATMVPTHRGTIDADTAIEAVDSALVGFFTRNLKSGPVPAWNPALQPAAD